MKIVEGSGNREPGRRQGAAKGGLHRFLRSLGLIIFSFLAAVVIMGAWFVMSEPDPHDIEHQWTIRWPGIPPGAQFTTQPGDDIRRMLEILRADTASDWQGPLGEKGAIEIQLAHHEMPSFWQRLSWAIRRPKGAVRLQARLVPMAVVGVQVVSADPKQYKVTLLLPDGTETVTGPLDSFGGAENAILDDLATVMQTLQGSQEA